MTSIFNKFKSLVAIGVMVFSLFIGLTLNSCTSEKKSDNTESVESTSESEEHPSNNEEKEEASEEHPASSEEHPSADTTKVEHPN